MKAYSFSFNTSDWLASPAVRLMSKAERGVYINLLALAWEAPQQGTLPASPDKVRRMAEMNAEEWAESGETILEKFPLSECGTYRYNPRLVLEAEKQEQKREINAEAGRRSAEKRAAEKAAKDSVATKPQRTSNENPTPVEPEPTGVEENPTISKVEESKVKEGAKEKRPPAPSPSQGKNLLWPDEAPTFLQANFQAFAHKIGYGKADLALYLPQIQLKAESLNEQRDNGGWEDFILRFFNNETRYDRLMLPAPDRVEKPPINKMPDDPRSLWGYVETPPIVEEPTTLYVVTA